MRRAEYTFSCSKSFSMKCSTSLHPGTGTLPVFTNERGGAIDDSVVTKVTDDHIYLGVNACCCDKDLAHIGEHLEAFKAKGGDLSWYIHDERSLLALQSPLSAPVLQHLTKDDLSKMYFGEFKTLDINGFKCFLTRTGLIRMWKAMIEYHQSQIMIISSAYQAKNSMPPFGSTDFSNQAAMNLQDEVLGENPNLHHCLHTKNMLV
ncbi:hypothetical protein KSP40_PGU007611 [Platanthera guangdongensis]|uniref:GCVT N-terminal domain-containing protein n=1 Tax=Platanthera guangdongensis TaxID=2320717 RepID=A0ABR2LFM9_9ASPA